MNNKLIVLGMTSTILAGSFVSVDAQMNTRCVQKDMYVNTISGLNYRKDPFVANGNKLGTLKYGEKVTTLAPEENGWVLVCINPESATNWKKAYVSAKFLSEVNPLGASQQEKGAFKVTTSTLNARSSAGTSSYARIVGKLKAGDTFDLVKSSSPRLRDGYWFREVVVKTAQNSSLVGRRLWVAVQYTNAPQPAQTSNNNSPAKPEASKPSVNKPNTEVSKPNTEVSKPNTDNSATTKPEESKPEDNTSAPNESKEHSKENCGPLSVVDHVFTGNQPYEVRVLNRDIVGFKENCEHSDHSNSDIIEAGTKIRVYTTLDSNNRTVIGFDRIGKDGVTEEVKYAVENYMISNCSTFIAKDVDSDY